jgi:preprotein translocase subunit SecY
MADGELPRAIASGGTEPSARSDDALVAVAPRRAALTIGALAAAFLVAVLYIVTPPTAVLRWLGGPSSDLERYGGARIVWEPRPGLDTTSLDGKYAREGNAYVIEAPGVPEDDVAVTAQRLAGSGRLEFVVVREVPEMGELARVLGLPMRNQQPVDVDVDQWRPEEGGPPHTDYYLHGHTRAAIETALDEAKRRGWHLPPGTHIAFEHGSRDWRTYVLDDEVALDGSAIANAYGSYDPNTNRPIILLDFGRDGGRKFGDLTARIVGGKLATVLDGEVKSAPVINTAIRGGRASITMGGADPLQQEADRDALVATLKAGSLPIGGRIVEARYVPPHDTTFRLLLARLLLAGAGGAVAGGLAWLAVLLLRPYRLRVRPLAGSAKIATKLVWTGVALAAFLIGVTIVLPGVNEVEITHVISRGSHREPGWFALESFSIFAIGLMPAITSHVIIEVIASIVPRWRKLRDGGPLARKRLGIAVGIATLVVATVQAYFIARYMESLSRGGAEIVAHPGMGWRWLTVATLVAGTMSLCWLASLITQRGIGNGYAVLIASGWLLSLPGRLEPLGGGELVLFAAGALAIAGIYLVASSWRLRGLRSAGILVPAAGIAPLSDAGGLMTLVGTLAALGVFGRLVSRTADLLQPLHYEAIAFAVVVVMSFVWTFAFARPKRRAKELARAELTAPTGEMFLRAALMSALVLVAIRALQRIAFHTDVTVGSLLDPLTLLVVTATIADVIGEARDRRRGLVNAWPLHDPLMADVVRDRLAANGIDSHIQAQRLRSLLWIFGSYVPMHVLVPEDRAADAAKLCRELFE